MNRKIRPSCSIEGCNAPHKARGWCRLHYERWQRTGSPIERSDLDRLMEKVSRGEYPTDCWAWTGATTANGYGRFQMGGVHWMAHRASFVLAGNEIPDGMQLDHLCRNTTCVNPDHLDVVTPRENTMRGTSFAPVNAAKTECHNGHPFDAENTYVMPDGGRGCRACRREADRRYKARKALIARYGLMAGGS